MADVFHTIDGQPGLWVESVTQKYRYADTKNKATCPVCGSCGWVWGHWYSCDGKDAPAHIALVGCGTVFLKYQGPLP